jgi:hypothetical protein
LTVIVKPVILYLDSNLITFLSVITEVLSLKRSDYGFLGYYSITGSPSLDLLELDLIDDIAIISYYGSDEVFETEIGLRIKKVGNDYDVSLSIADEFDYFYSLDDFKMVEGWRDKVRMWEGSVWINFLK